MDTVQGSYLMYVQWMSKSILSNAQSNAPLEEEHKNEQRKQASTNPTAQHFKLYPPPPSSSSSSYPKSRKATSRHKQPREPNDLPPTTDTGPEIVHRQANAALFAETQAATRPDEDGARGALADDALWWVGGVGGAVAVEGRGGAGGRRR